MLDLGSEFAERGEWSAIVVAGRSSMSRVVTTSTAAGASRVFSSVREAVIVIGLRLKLCSDMVVDSGGTVVAQGITGPAGAYRINDIPTGTYTVRFTSPGWATATMSSSSSFARQFA